MYMSMDMSTSYPKNLKKRETQTHQWQRVKNKTPAPIQITAEQIIREARQIHDSEMESIRPPKHKIIDSIELAEYQTGKRSKFEDLVRRNLNLPSVWVNYAQWESSQKDFNRARSVWERALEANYTIPTLYLKYAEMEMKNKFVNHARNVFDRAVTYLPRIDQLWYKWIHMEQALGNLAGARQIFERWMEWNPDQQGWLSYIKFELKYHEVDRARGLYRRLVEAHPRVGTWIGFAKFEAKMGEVGRARSCYERAVDVFGEDDDEADILLLAFAEFEERCKEIERARCIYKFVIDRILPKGKGQGRARDVYTKFVAFEKRYGDKQGIEDAVAGKRKFQLQDDEQLSNTLLQGMKRSKVAR